MAANARFFEELAKLPQRLYDDLRTSMPEQGKPPRKDLDYDSIATLVAAKLSQKGQPPPSGRGT